jgi:hypothetical protein
MYCPECFNNSLKINSRGVVRLAFNGKSKETSLFLYNISKDKPDEVKKNVTEKFDEFFKWYAGFKNADPIKNIELYSNDFTCSNNCKILLTTKITIVGLLISQKDVNEIANQVANKYNLQLQLNS